MYAEFQDRYEHTGRTRAAIRGFIKYLVSYEQGQQNKENPEPTTSEPWTQNPEPTTLYSR